MIGTIMAWCIQLNNDTVQYDNVYWRSTTAGKVALYINKSQDMALLAGANITGLNHTLQKLITETISTLQAGNPRESTQNREF